MKKYKLKQHIKDKLVIVMLVVMLVVMLLLVKQSLNNYNDMAKECDIYYNNTCTHYDINNYSKTR